VIVGGRNAKMLSKLDHAVIAAAVAGELFWIEHGHRVVIEPPTSRELALPAATAPCPDKDTVPYSASCIAFLTGRHWQPVASRSFHMLPRS
jgi:hypothetical protein